MVQIVVHQLVPKTNQKKLRPEKKVQSSGRWRRLIFGRNVTTKKNKTYSPLAGYVFQWVQITTGKNYDQKKKVLSSRLTGHFFPAGSNYNQNKITTGKIKGTVICPMEAAQIWREHYDRKKKCTVVWPAMFFGGFKLEPEKIMTG